MTETVERVSELPTFAACGEHRCANYNEHAAWTLCESKSSEEAVTRSILIEQVRLLYQGNVVAGVNALNSVLVAAVLWRQLPHVFLVVWALSCWTVVGLRIRLRQSYRTTATTDADAQHWARRFTVGAGASGLLWAVLIAVVPHYGSARELVLLILVGAGMTAGGLTSLAPYLPAYVAYALPFSAALSMVCLMTARPDLVALGIMILVYALIMAATAHNVHKSIERTLRLQAVNMLLNDSLRDARANLENAKKDKWSTIGHLSHELRTPLNAILGFSEAMHSELFGMLGHPKYREYAGYVHGAGVRLLGLTSELLDLAQAETGTLHLHESDIDVAELIKESVRLIKPLAEDRRIHVTQLIGIKVAQFHGDERRVSQILGTLLSNAIKFTPEGGSISISAHLAADGGITLSVSDTGVGMNASDISRALKPFERLSDPLTRQAEGAGLGLPLCKYLVELHGAALTIDSQLGKGTSCSVRFPAFRTMIRED